MKLLEIVFQRQNNTYKFNTLSKCDSWMCSMSAEKFDKCKFGEESRINQGNLLIKFGAFDVIYSVKNISGYEFMPFCM